MPETRLLFYHGEQLGSSRANPLLMQQKERSIPPPPPRPLPKPFSVLLICVHTSVLLGGVHWSCSPVPQSPGPWSAEVHRMEGGLEPEASEAPPSPPRDSAGAGVLGSARLPGVRVALGGCSLPDQQPATASGTAPACACACQQEDGCGERL